MRLMMLAALGGALGSAARYAAVLLAARLVGTEFPWGTLAVNVSGSLAIGVLTAAVSQWYPGVPGLRVFLISGVLGGFTTFSAFSFEIFSLLERKAVAQAVLYAAGSVLISLLAVSLGYLAMKAIAQ
jgi:fluoride exporter